MEFLDIAITIAFTGAAFVMGFCARGVLSESSTEEWPALEQRSGQYEPPRRNERI